MKHINSDQPLTSVCVTKLIQIWPTTLSGSVNDCSSPKMHYNMKKGKT